MENGTHARRSKTSSSGSPRCRWARYLFDWQAYAIPTGMTYLKMLADADGPLPLHETCRGRPVLSRVVQCMWPKQRQERIRSSACCLRAEAPAFSPTQADGARCAERGSLSLSVIGHGRAA